MEYVGELLDYKEFVRRTRQYNKQQVKHHYFMALNSDELIDATLKGSNSRFLNHSCDPNCETQKVGFDGLLWLLGKGINQTIKLIMIIMIKKQV